MEYIKFGTYTGSENMRIDSDLLENAIKTDKNVPVFRLYAWSPKCVSLGRNQIVKDNSFCGLDVVRRVTGGRALLHDNEITYSYVTPILAIPNGETVIESYKYISKILIDFFQTLGIELDFGGKKEFNPIANGNPASHIRHDYCMLISTGADVCYQGKKIIGSAQYRKHGYILQHGSILFGYDKELLEKLFNEPVTDSSITTVNEILPNMTKEKFVELLEDYIIHL